MEDFSIIERLTSIRPITEKNSRRLTSHNGFVTAEPECAKIANRRFEKKETGKLLNDQENKNTQKATTIEMSFIFKFRMLELKNTAKIIVGWELCGLLQNSIKCILSLLSSGNILNK